MIRTPQMRRATEMLNRRRIRLVDPDGVVVPKNINMIADYEKLRKVRDDTV